MEPDDLLLPDPSELTEEVTPVRRSTWEWPFSTRDTILLGLLYVAPFVIGWLTHL